MLSAKEHASVAGMRCAERRVMAEREPSNNELYLMQRKRRDVVLSPQEQRVDEVLERWTSAMRFRRTVERSLGAHGVSFSQWRVLYTTDRIEREFSDAMTQVEVARRLDACESTVSAVMQRLWRSGLLDIEPAYWGNLRAVLTADKGRRLLAATLGHVVSAAEEPFFANKLVKAG
jgi:DNA-binding MarR family transcriptional regulator